MAQTRTAKGSNSSKASGTSLSVNNVTCDEGSSLLVAVAYDNSQGQPTIKFGKKVLDLIDKQINDGTGFTVGMWWGRNIRRATERDIVVTWPSAILARAMFATQITEASEIDIKSENQQDATISPTTGPNISVQNISTIHIHAFMGNGPVEDTQGVASANDTFGQRDGTTGGIPTSNVFIQETYELQIASVVSAGSFTIDVRYQIITQGAGSPLTDFTLIGAPDNNAGTQFVATGIGSGTGTAYEFGNMRGRIANATSRDWAAEGIAFKPKLTYIINDIYQRRWYTSPDANAVITAILTEPFGGSPQISEIFEFQLDEADFDGMTDQTYYERVTTAASWHAQHKIDGTLGIPDVDETRETRMAALVGSPPTTVVL